PLRPPPPLEDPRHLAGRTRHQRHHRLHLSPRPPLPHPPRTHRRTHPSPRLAIPRWLARWCWARELRRRLLVIRVPLQCVVVLRVEITEREPEVLPLLVENHMDALEDRVLVFGRPWRLPRLGEQLRRDGREQVPHHGLPLSADLEYLGVGWRLRREDGHVIAVRLVLGFWLA